MNNFPTPRTENHPTGLMYGFAKGLTQCDGPFYNIGLSYESETKTVLDYWVSQGYNLPSTGRIKMLNDTIKHLKLRGIWSQLDIFYLFATDGDQNCAFTNLISPTQFKASLSFPAAGVSNSTYPAHHGVYGGYSGFASGQSTGINLNFNPATNAVKATQDDNSIFGYCYPASKGNSGDNGDFMGNSHLAGAFLFSYFGTFFWLQNETPASGAGAPRRVSTNVPFFFHGKRISSSTKEAWMSGVLSGQTAATSTVFNSTNLSFMKNITTGQLFNTYGGCFGFGASLNGLEANLNNIIQRYVANVI